MAYLLSDSDVQILKTLVQRVKQQPFNAQPSVSMNDEEFPSPDVYVAWIPGTGIPSLTMAPGTGTGTGSFGGEGDRAGSAICWVHRITGDGKELLPIGKQQRVHNVSSTAVPGDTWAVVARDKFGSWVVIHAEGVGGPDGILAREVDGAPSGTASQFWFDHATGVILTSVTGGIATVALAAASTTQMGAVTTGVQEIAGVKRMADPLVLSNGMRMMQDTGFTGGVPDYSLDVAWQEILSPPFDFGSKWSLTKQVLGATAELLSVQDYYQNYATPGLGSNLRLTLGSGTGVGSIGMAMGFTGFSLTEPCFWLVTSASSGFELGVYGTTAGGDTVKGGIITALGSGGGGSVAWSSITGKPTTLAGYGITDAQPLDADLTAIAALTGTNTIYYRSAASTWSAVTIGTNLTFSGGTLSASGGSSYTDEMAQDAVGNILTDSSSIDFTYDDAANTITAVVKAGGITNAMLAGSIDLTTKVTGILPVPNGGTGASTLTARGVVLGNGTSAVAISAAGTSGQVFTSGGSGANGSYQAPVTANAVQAAMSSSFAITGSSGTFQSTGLGLTLTAGTYLIIAQVRGQLNVTAGIPAFIRSRFRNVTDSLDILHSDVLVCLIGVTGQLFNTTAVMMNVVTLTGTKLIELWACRQGGTTYTNSDILSDTNAETKMCAVQVGP